MRPEDRDAAYLWNALRAGRMLQELVSGRNVRIPKMEIVALERVGVREGKTVDAVLAKELLDFMSVHAGWLSRDVAGFAEALGWPG